MKWLAVILALALAGCATTGGHRGSRWLPWNWGASDSTAKVERAQQRVDAANTALREDAHRNALATSRAIEAEKARQLQQGGVSRELTTAAEYAERTVRDLDASEGVLAFDVQAELQRTVALRNSQLAAERTRGDTLLAAADKIATNAAGLKITWTQKLADAHQQVGEEQQRALVAEEKWNRAKFMIWAVAIGGLVLWLGGQVLTRLAQANPVFAPFAAGFNMLAAPALKSSWDRVADMTDRVGTFMARIRQAGPELAAKVEPVLDGVMDLHHQDAIGAAATAAGAGPKL